MGPLMVSFPYHSHVFRDSYGSGMGMVWEAYHKGVALLGVPENPIGSVLCIWGVAPILFMEEIPNNYLGCKKPL